MCSCSCEWKVNIRESEAPRGTGVDESGLPTRDLSSLVTEEHSRARVRDRHQLINYHRLPGASRSSGSPRDWNKSSAYWRPASKLVRLVSWNRSKMLKTKMSQHFTAPEKRKEIFSQAPCISQAPFHAPIRGGCPGGGRFSKMNCSDTTQSLQVALER